MYVGMKWIGRLDTLNEEKFMKYHNITIFGFKIMDPPNRQKYFHVNFWDLCRYLQKCLLCSNYSNGSQWLKLILKSLR